MQLPGAGIATASGVVKQGATLARAAARTKCKRGFIRKHGRCTRNAPVPFGATALIAPVAGTYTIVVTPNQRARSALKRGKKLYVTVSVTFQSRAGGAPVTHAQSVLVKIKKPGRRKR